MTLRYLVTGAAGQVGARVVDRLVQLGADVHGFGRTDLDITDAGAVARVITTLRPDVVINAAAYTAVDAAEADHQTARRINADGPEILASALRPGRARLIHISTDYVFAGDADRPYETNDRTAPRTEYGRSKVAGEQAVMTALADRAYVVRTAWVYGGPGSNFVATVLRLEHERTTVDVVDDQRGSPTYAADLAVALVELAGRPDVGPGVRHFVNSGIASWYELATAAFAAVGADPARVRPVGTDQMPRPAARPHWSVLATTSWTAAGLAPPRHWRDALADCVLESCREMPMPTEL